LYFSFPWIGSAKEELWHYKAFYDTALVMEARGVMPLNGGPCDIYKVDALLMKFL